MPDQDTSVGGARRDFPGTSWSIVAGFRGGDDRRVREALGRLAERYWKAVYLYIRQSWKRSNDDAKDLTQSFFAWLLEKDVLSKYDPSRGGFRAFLRVVLKTFLGHEHEARSALRRGGAVFRLPETALGAVADEDPDRSFERAWMEEVVSRAMTATRDAFEGRGKAKPWRAYELYELDPAPSGTTYAEVARQLGIKESDVRNHIHAVRKELKRHILDELSETVVTPEQLREEWRALLRS